MSKILTVSVAAYNVADYLSDTLQSCVNSNSDDLEVIIVNDGSTDSTLQVARDFERRMPSIFKVIDQSNNGYGSTINASLYQASGKYFRYLDGDDWFDTDALLRYINKLKDCNEDAVFSPYTRVYEDGRPEEVRDDLDGYGEGVLSPAGFSNKADIAGCALAFKTELLRDMGFKMTEQCFFTDVEYACLPFANVSTVRVFKEPLYCYRIGREGQSVSVAGIERHWEDIIRVCTRLLFELGDAAFEISEYLGMTVSKECTVPYYYLTIIPPNRDRKLSLIAFDKLVKRYPRIYSRTAELSRRVRTLRRSRFCTYWPLCSRRLGGGR